MSGRVEGKVAFITGAGRGQGRCHAIRLAEEGADIIAVDVPEEYATLKYPMASQEDLDETVRGVEALGRRIVAFKADVRDRDALGKAVDAGVKELGRLDIVVANAGICTVQPWDEITNEVWQEVVDTNLTGVWNTLAVSIPHLIEAGGGSIIATSSTAGIKGQPFLVPYAAAKHGMVGLCRSLAHELAAQHIRINTVHPTGVETPMLQGLGRLDSLLADAPKLGPIFMNTYPAELVQPSDVANAVLYLASEESRYVTGLEMTVDAGNTIR
jgi:SDR family mycofactocin-dependent oxidoreductase